MKHRAEAGPAWRVCVITLFGALAIASCESRTTNPFADNPLTLAVTPAGPVTLNAIGQTLTIVASTSGGDGSAAVVTYTSSSPSVASVNGTTGVVTAKGPGTATIIITAAQVGKTVSAAVQVTVSSPGLTFTSVTRISDNTVVANNSVSGNVNVNFDVANTPLTGEATGSLAVDGGTPSPCTITGNKLVCPVNTAGFNATTLAPNILNGNRAFAARMVTSDGTVVATTSQSLTLTNRSLFSFNSNDPPNPPSPLWRGGDLAVTVKPVFFGGPSTGLTVGLTPARTSGTGTLVLNQTGAIAAPFTFTINSTASANAEGTFSATPVFFNNGVDVTGQFDGSPFQANVDLLAPRITNNTISGNTAISEQSVTLGHTTGPYAAGVVLPLSRISGGLVFGADAGCDASHLNGNITIKQATGSGTDGPFPDPATTTLNDPCGHGKITNRPLDRINLNLSGTITEGAPFSARFQLFNGVNGCDGATLIDDTPVATGTGPGQSSNPDQTVTQSGPFAVPFVVFVNGAQADKFICPRFTISDAAVNALGVKSNIPVSQQQATKLVDPTPLSLTVTPAGPIHMLIGATTALDPHATGGPGGATLFTYVPLEPNLLSVDIFGHLTALSNGATSVTVTADQEGVKVSQKVVVLIDAPVLTHFGPPSPVSGNVNFIFTIANKPLTTVTGTASVGSGTPTNCTISGNQMVCPINTAGFNPATFQPFNGNGSHPIIANLISGNGGLLATTSQDVVFANRNTVTGTVNGLAPSGSLWNAGDVVVSLTPVIYNGSANSLASVTVSLTTSGQGVNSGPVTLNQQAPIPAPFNFTINQGASATAEGTFHFVPRMFNAQGVETSSDFDITPFDVNIDTRAPRVTMSGFTPNTFISTGNLLLGHDTGPFPAGTVIDMSRVLNAQIIGAHPPACDATHVHGSISILNGGSTVGPFQDPEFYYSDPCGHGKITVVPLNSVNMSLSGTITDGSTVSGTFRLFLGLNGCDGNTLVDDTPIPLGTGPGQSPNPIQTISGGGIFNNTFQLNVSPSMANNNICARVLINDAATNVQGLHPNVFSNNQATTLKQYGN